MNKPTKEEMLDLLERMKKCEHQTEAIGGGRLIFLGGRDILTYNALLSLIESSPEPGEKRGEEYIEYLKAERKRAIDACAVPEKFLKPAPSPAPLPSEAEAAMATIEHDSYYGGDDTWDKWRDRMRAALATIRAALTEARQPKVVSGESGHVSPTGGKQQESEMTTEEPK